MLELLNSKTGVLFMKVGTHAQEPLEAIIARKTREIENAGYGLWGYGGNTCHPSTMVQPFARAFENKGGKILLCMHEMNSNHRAEQVRADQMSVDGIKWETIPSPINVLGSRYALVIESLRREQFELPLGNTVVAVGNSQGRSGSRYVAGRVDKACLEMALPKARENTPDDRIVKIDLVAELRSPYAVFLKNRQ